MHYIIKNIIFILALFFIGTHASANFNSKDHLELFETKIETSITPLDLKKLNSQLNTDYKEVKENVADTVKSTSSSVKKEKKNKNKNEEMVFYSYGTPKVSKKPIHKTPKISIDTLEKLGFNDSKKTKPIIDYSKFIQSSYQKTTKDSFKIKLTPVTVKGLSKTSLANFDLVPYYDLNELLSDSGTGTISIPITNKKQEYSTYRASVAARGVLRTNFELAAQPELLVNIPVFELETLSKLLEDHKIVEEHGSYLLIDLGDEVDSTTIEGKFKKKLFLNDKLRVVEEGSAYRFELYMDLEPGNHMIKYMSMKGHVAEKIIHITQGEMTYDEPLLEKSRYVNLDIFEENLAAKKLSKVDIDRKFVTYFNKNRAAKKSGLNRYKINIPLRDAAFRNYVAIGEESPIYIGFRDLEKVVIPSQEYSSYIKSLFNLGSGSKACIIQMNFNSYLKDFNARVASDRETGSFDIYYMDKDGTFSKEMTGISEKAFIVSHDFGVLNARIDYTNNETEYIQSFCTENLYLVEQL